MHVLLLYQIFIHMISKIVYWHRYQVGCLYFWRSLLLIMLNLLGPVEILNICSNFLWLPTSTRHPHLSILTPPVPYPIIQPVSIGSFLIRYINICISEICNSGYISLFSICYGQKVIEMRISERYINCG